MHHESDSIPSEKALALLIRRLNTTGVVCLALGFAAYSIGSSIRDDDAEREYRRPLQWVGIGATVLGVGMFIVSMEMYVAARRRVERLRQGLCPKCRCSLEGDAESGQCPRCGRSYSMAEAVATQRELEEEDERNRPSPNFLVIAMSLTDRGFRSLVLRFQWGGAIFGAVALHLSILLYRGFSRWAENGMGLLALTLFVSLWGFGLGTVLAVLVVPERCIPDADRSTWARFMGVQTVQGARGRALLFLCAVAICFAAAMWGIFFAQWS